jgi:cytidine deaminase
MTDATDELVRLALEARRRAYAPYSGFAVGAALRTADGRVFTGANVENASYGLALCAERAAVATAVNAGARDIVELVVASPTTPPVTPCGMCRQTLAEFARELPILLVNERGERTATSLEALLPLAFQGDVLPRR